MKLENKRFWFLLSAVSEGSSSVKVSKSLNYKLSMGLGSEFLNSVNNYYCWCSLFLLWQFVGASLIRTFSNHPLSKGF